MRRLYRASLVSLLSVCLALPAVAQESSQLDQPAPNAAPLPSTTPAALTGKERLGKKWMDEQRIDNCKVPVEKRGTQPRPSTCPHVPTG
jgi:hypothetical protein